MYLTKLVKLHEPYRLFSTPSNSLPFFSYISYKSQSYWYINCRFISLTLSYSFRMSAKITVFFLRLSQGYSSKVNLETYILLILAECNLSALVILVELASPAAAVLPFGVMNFSSSSQKGPFFLRFSEEKQILVCCLYLFGLAARENHFLNESKSQGRGNLLAMSSKKYSFFLSPLIRYKFFTSSMLNCPSQANISNKSTKFLYCMLTVLLKVSALSKF